MSDSLNYDNKECSVWLRINSIFVPSLSDYDFYIDALHCLGDQYGNFKQFYPLTLWGSDGP